MAPRRSSSLLIRFATLLVLGLLLAPTARAARLTGSVSTSRTQVGQAAIITLVITGDQVEDRPTLPSLSGLTTSLMGVQSRGNGVHLFRYSVVPSRPGTYQWPAITAKVDGEQVTTQLPALVVTPAAPMAPTPAPVAPPTPPQPAAEPEDSYGSLTIKLAQPEVYLGQMFTLELEMLVRYSGNVEVPNLNTDGIVLGKSSNPMQSKAQVDGEIYSRLLFRHSATTAKAGLLTVGPATCGLTLQVPQTLRQGNVISRQWIRKDVTLESEPVELRVLPLPTNNVPASFQGAVGRYHTFLVEASPTNLTAGDPITVTIRIAGDGAFENVHVPLGAGWREFQVFPPNEIISTDASLGTTGSKSIEQVVSPRNTEVTFIPALEFSFFDPMARQYRTLRNEPIPINVEPAAGGAVQPTIVVKGLDGAGGDNQSADIIHIKPHLGTIVRGRSQLGASFWLLCLLPMVALFAVIVWKRYERYLLEHPEIVRERQVDRLVRARLLELDQLARGGHAEAFHQIAYATLQERLGERLGRPAPAITEGILTNGFAASLPGDLCDELQDAFDNLNRVRYGRHSPESLKETLSLLEPLLAGIRKLPRSVAAGHQVSEGFCE